MIPYYLKVLIVLLDATTHMGGDETGYRSKTKSKTKSKTGSKSKSKFPTKPKGKGKDKHRRGRGISPTNESHLVEPDDHTNSNTRSCGTRQSDVPLTPQQQLESEWRKSSAAVMDGLEVDTQLTKYQYEIMNSIENPQDMETFFSWVEAWYCFMSYPRWEFARYGRQPCEEAYPDCWIERDWERLDEELLGEVMIPAGHYDASKPDPEAEEEKEEEEEDWDPGFPEDDDFDPRTLNYYGLAQMFQNVSADGIFSITPVFYPDTLGHATKDIRLTCAQKDAFREVRTRPQADAFWESANWGGLEPPVRTSLSPGCSIEGYKYMSRDDTGWVHPSWPPTLP
jgi:hypothetical protein